MPLQLLAFDCDGVILESMDVKSEAYARLAVPCVEWRRKPTRKIPLDVSDLCRPRPLAR